MKIDLFLKFKTFPGQELKIIVEKNNIVNLNHEQPVSLTYHDHDYWNIELDFQQEASKKTAYLNFSYQFIDNNNHTIREDWGKTKYLSNLDLCEGLTIIDSWNEMGSVENAYYTVPFQKVFQNFHKVNVPKAIKTGVLRLTVKAPLLSSDEELCLLGNSDGLGNWNQSHAKQMQFDGSKWYIDFDKDELTPEFEYKYCIRNVETGSIVFEIGENRKFKSPNKHCSAILILDNYVRDERRWRGTGVAIPVFSLRTKNSLGVGEFTDIKIMVDWAKKVSIKMIQLLPVNDTTSTHSRLDSYPYAAISAYALHPLYISLERVAGSQFKKAINNHLEKKHELNLLDGVDYESVMELKWDALTILYELMKQDVFKDADYLDFFNDNKHWLIPYAAYSFLRDKFGAADPTKWGQYEKYDEAAIKELSSSSNPHYDRIAIHYFIQYHLHLQLKDAHDYANANGIILKGDIAIGVHRYGADTWTDPSLYHLDRQAGAPPDDFAVSGQNWGFPTYNWERMKADGFAWWKSRFEQMSNYFDAFRIDHILGFFRIWSIPEHAVEGIMGRFVPAIPIGKNELENHGIWIDENRLTTPFISSEIISQLAPEFSNDIYAFLDDKGNGQFQFKPQYLTQKQVEQYFNTLPETEHNQLLKQKLFNLQSNVILWKDDKPGHYHFRFNASKTLSFQFLDFDSQHRLQSLYNDYFFSRQEKIWRAEAIEKLPALKKCTEMLICGEDLGMVPKSVPEIMSYLGFLSMEVQRMPKDPHQKFFDPLFAHYLSVVTPSTHDMSTIREWWLENREAIQNFYNLQLGQHGHAPNEATPYIAKSILLQHLSSPAMWSVFQMQDLFAINPSLRIENPYNERINIPGDSKHYWRFRMHYCLEDLIQEQTFNDELSFCITSSGR